MSLFCLIYMHTHVFSLFTRKRSYLLGWNAAEHIYNRTPRARRRRRRRRCRTRRVPRLLGTRNGARPVRRSFVGLLPGAQSTRSHAPPYAARCPANSARHGDGWASRGVNRVAPSFPLPFSFSSLARIPSPSSPVSDPDQVWFLVFVALINYSFYMFRHVSIN